VNEVDENDELIKRLQQWKQNKKAYELRMFIDKLAKAHLNLNENEIKIMIIKLIQIEKLLKEIGKVKKAKGAKSPKRKENKVYPMKMGNQTILEDEDEFDQLVPLPQSIKKTTSNVVQRSSSQMKREVRASSKLELSPDGSPEREALVKRPDSQSQFGGSKFGKK
jgi:inorganic pyrophosphatase